MNVVVVYNPKSGSALPANEIKQLFHDANITITELLDVTDSIEKKLEKYTATKTIIAAIGGDGTISSVVQHIVGTSAVLAPLPGGTLNHFTKDLGVDQDLAKAIAAIPAKRPKNIDVATVNDKVFINNSSIGMYPSSLHARKRFEDKLGKWPAAVVAILRTIIQYRTYTVTIKDESYTTPFVFVGNNKYDLANAAERKRIDMGLMCVYIISASKRLDLLKVLLQAIVGRIDQHDNFTEYDVTSVTIASRKRSKMSVSRDGEVERMEMPLRYVLLSGELSVIV